MLTVLDSGSEARFDIALPPGLRLYKVGNIVEVRDATLRVTVGQFQAPWAVDAKNVQLPTSYDLDGNTIIQHIDTANASYPVVADPWITFGWNIYLHLEPWFQKALIGAGVAGAAFWIGGAICVPTIVGGPAVLACGAAVAAAGYLIWATVDHYYNPSRNLTLKFAWCCPPGAFNGWYYG